MEDKGHAAVTYEKFKVKYYNPYCHKISFKTHMARFNSVH
jgi:hypothetical protein